MSAVLTIDEGTTGVTALVVSDEGRIVGRAYSEFTQHYPQPGWVEHDANEIWAVTQRVARTALAAAGADADVRALGITNQRETIVVWDRATGEPVHRAIVWQDRRTSASAPAAASAVRATRCVTAQISFASCSTQPGCG